MIAVLASLISTAAPQLASADIAITFGTEHAVVDASYRVGDGSDSLAAFLIKVRGQDVRFDRMTGGGWSTEWPGLYRGTLSARAGVAAVRYEVRGALTRIPIVVPEAPADPGTTRIAIRVRGLDDGAALTDGFPRLVRAADGSVIAQPENLPSFVRIPRRGGVSVNRAADAAVMVLVLTASTWFIVRRRFRSGFRPSEEA